MHVDVAFGSVQDAPQAPQWSCDAIRSVSQPLACTASQLPKPASHEATWQAPPLHEAVACASEQTLPHAPQLVTELVRSVSHTASRSQSPRPAAQRVRSHTPALHTPAASGKEQTVPHAPQLRASVWMLTSQPSTEAPLQFAKPALQAARLHTPSAHVAEALGRTQARPHPPQLFGSPRVSVSQPFAGLPSQSAQPGRHTEQLPSLPQPRCSDAGQSSSAQQARQTAPPQQRVPTAHSSLRQTPSTQRSVVQPLASAHWLSLQQAAQMPPPQSRNPPAHAQLPEIHVRPMPHALPHAPQCILDVLRLTSQPLLGSPSQSAKPA